MTNSGPAPRGRPAAGTAPITRSQALFSLAAGLRGRAAAARGQPVTRPYSVLFLRRIHIQEPNAGHVGRTHDGPAGNRDGPLSVLHQETSIISRDQRISTGPNPVC